jgi:hypothetical protein
MNKNKITALVITASMLLGSTVFAQPLKAEGTLKAVPISADLKQNTVMKAYIFNRTLDEENQYVKVAGKLPIILGMKDWKYQMQLNTALTRQAMKDKQTVEEESKKMAEAAKEYGWTVRPADLIIKYEVKNNNDILSFVVNTYMYTGGANGQTRVDTYNVDLREVKNINLSDLFKSGTDYKTVINNEISAQIESRTKYGDAFFKGEMGFKSISDNQNYYIQEDNLVILFQKYAIAPGAMGTPDFRIPLKSLNSMLKSEYVKDALLPGKPENGKKQVAFNSFTGTVKEINDLQAEKGLKFVSLESDLGEKATIVISNDTYVVDNAQITEGAVITGFYDATAPMIMIYPPQYRAEVVNLVEKGKNVKVDRFDENLLSSDLWLKLNISEATEIITEDGKAFDGNLKNRNLIVFYGATTKSLPPQTTPTKIVVLSEKDNNK